MTHPLTDEICADLSGWDFYGCPNIYVQWERQDMRAVADWQLEQVKEKVKLKLKEWRREGYGAGADACEDFFEEIMQELRPQDWSEPPDAVKQWKNLRSDPELKEATRYFIQMRPITTTQEDK